MKNLYFVLFCVISSFSFGQFGQIMNGGFENWTNQTLFDYPTQWGNSNSDEYRGTPTVLKSTDAQDGSYSIEVRSEQVGPDTLFGYIYQGAVGQGGPSGGIGYNDIFNEVAHEVPEEPLRCQGVPRLVPGIARVFIDNNCRFIGRRKKAFEENRVPLFQGIVTGFRAQCSKHASSHI